MKPIKIASGKYQIAKQVNGKRKYFYGNTPKECTSKFDAWNGNIGAPLKTFKTEFKAWMEDYVVKQSESTYSQYDTLSKTHIIPILGLIKVDKILPFNCQSVLDNARNKNSGGKLSDATLGHIRKIMHAFFEYQKLMKKSIRENPCVYLTMPKGSPTRERRSATPQELDIIWNRMEGSHYFYCFQFLLLTGLRPSEVCGIRFADIKGTSIKIKESRTRFETSSGKTKNAKREIDISPIMTNIINLQKQYCVKQKFKLDYLFPTLDGEPSNSGYLTRAWSRLMEDTGISLTLYELRHTFVSLTIDKLPIKDLQTLIGHSSRMDTSSTYAHIFKEKKDNAGIIDGAVSKYLPDDTTKGVV